MLLSGTYPIVIAGSTQGTVELREGRQPATQPGGLLGKPTHCYLMKTCSVRKLTFLWWIFRHDIYVENLSNTAIGNLRDYGI
jgi:hypothetical protein